MNGTSSARALSADEPSMTGRSDQPSSGSTGRLQRALSTIRRRGLSYGLYLPFGAWLPRWFYERFSGSRNQRRQLTALGLAAVTLTVLTLSLLLVLFGPLAPISGLTMISIVAAFFWLHGARHSLGDGPQEGAEFLEWREWSTPSATSSAIEALELEPGQEVVLARIDNDGRAHFLHGALPDLVSVPETDFVPRRRFSLDLVLLEGLVLVRKGYRGDRTSFSRELAALRRLRGVTGAPQLHSSRPEDTVLFKSWIPGKTLRDQLVEAGARILSVDTETDPELATLSPAQRIEAVWARGRAVLDDVAPNLTSRLGEALDRIHRGGVTGVSLTFGNVVIDSGGQPHLIDLDRATTHRRSAGPWFQLHRDRDRRTLRSIYDTEHLCEREARALLRGPLATPYSPIDLGRGLVTRGFWSVDSGSGRWDTLNAPYLRPLIEGRRVLDLGVHNAVMSLLMLRDGAREVVAFERDPEVAETARRMKSLFEWRYMRPFPLQVECRDMRAILEQDWGEFDIVTTFCSLYYLCEEDMVRVVNRAHELAPILVLQAKTDTRVEAADDKARKSTLEYLRRLVEENGFSIVERVAPEGVTRPLLIAERNSSSPKGHA